MFGRDLIFGGTTLAMRINYHQFQTQFRTFMFSSFSTIRRHFNCCRLSIASTRILNTELIS